MYRCIYRDLVAHGAVGIWGSFIVREKFDRSWAGSRSSRCNGSSRYNRRQFLAFLIIFNTSLLAADRFAVRHVVDSHRLHPSEKSSWRDSTMKPSSSPFPSSSYFRRVVISRRPRPSDQDSWRKSSTRLSYSTLPSIDYFRRVTISRRPHPSENDSGRKTSTQPSSSPCPSSG